MDPCCTDTTRCALARSLATRYWEHRGTRGTKPEIWRATARVYTQHLYAAGLRAYPTTCIPTNPATWDDA